MALERYAAAGGDNVAEAQAVLAFRDGRETEAFAWLKEGCPNGSCYYRLRNYMLALMH
jgi:hypothetical protein